MNIQKTSLGSSLITQIYSDWGEKRLLFKILIFQGWLKYGPNSRMHGWMAWTRVSQSQHHRHLGQVILCCGGCLVHSGMFTSIPDFCPLDAGNIPLPQSWQSKISLDIAKYSIWSKITLIKTNGLDTPFSSSHYVSWPSRPSFRKLKYIRSGQGYGRLHSFRGPWIPALSLTSCMALVKLQNNKRSVVIIY